MQIERQSEVSGISVTYNPDLASRKRPLVAVGRQIDHVVIVDYPIASSSLCQRAVLDFVGGMQEEVFPDCVDIEWGLHARHAKMMSLGVFDGLIGWIGKKAGND